MDWNSITLTVLAAFGLLSLVVTLLIQFVKQLPELFRSIREAWAALKPKDQDEGGVAEDRDEPRSA